MKRISMLLVLLITAASLFAGDGKHCDMKKTSSKSVELTGTLAATEDGNVFRVANSGDSYKVCHKTKNANLKLNDGKTSLKVKGQLVSCGDGTELMIEEAKKI